MLKEIRQAIQDNMYSEQHKDGFFTQEEAQYLACLELKQAQLEALFRKDKAHWEARVKTAD